MPIEQTEKTKFEDVYKAFLSSVDSFQLAKMDDQELEETLWEWLDAARVPFVNYKIVDFYDVDMENKCFNSKLSHAEVALLAKSMKLEWVRMKKHSEDVMNKSLGDRDYNAVQGYNYLKQYSVMETQLVNEINKMINKIEYANSKIYGDMA